MNMVFSPGAAVSSGHSELWHHAKIARSLGSPFVAAVLEAGDRQLDRAPQTAALIRQWEGDPSLAAVAMRFNAALHALARRQASPTLSTLYARRHADFDGAIGAALEAHDGFVESWMHHVPQTNEVGRSAAIAAALMEAGTTFGLPFELLEIGASCGLNLNLGRYAFQLGETTAGMAGSSVQIAPRWIGPAPTSARIEIIGARGVDLNPLEASDADTRDRLHSFIWADQPQRSDRLEQALALAQLHPSRVDRGEATVWLAEQLAVPQRMGLCRVVFHSMVMQYLAARDRYAIAAMINEAGASATPRRPLAWISFERTQVHYEVQLRLTCWPTGQSRLLGTCHAYGDWIDWRGACAQAG